MKTIVLGWKDADARGPVEIIAAPDISPAEQSGIMDDADLHRFPPGVKFIAQFGLTDSALRQAQFISEEVATYKQEGHKKAAAREKEVRDRLRKENQRVNQQAEANKAVTAAATKRNQALAAVSAQKNLLGADLPAANKDKIALKILDLQAIAENSIKEFEVILAARNVVFNPKSEPADIAAAQEILKTPAKGLALKAAADKAAADKAAADKAAADKAAGNSGTTNTPENPA